MCVWVCASQTDTVHGVAVPAVVKVRKQCPSAVARMHIVKLLALLNINAPLVCQTTACTVDLKALQAGLDAPRHQTPTWMEAQAWQLQRDRPCCLH